MPRLRRLATFATVGASATVGYAMIAGALASVGVAPWRASLIAYGICAGLSYLAHKRFTFGSAAPHRIEAPRFVVATLVGLLVALATPLLCARLLGPSPYFGILATSVIAPVISFLAAERFVFRPAA
jgi:putative flippase GtrA